MNVIWITSDSLRRDHIGAYGNSQMQTPSLDRLAAGSVRFQRHYAAAFPTIRGALLSDDFIVVQL